MRPRCSVLLVLALAGCAVAPPPPTFKERMQAITEMSQAMQAMRAPVPPERSTTEKGLAILEQTVRELQGQLLELRGLIRDLATKEE